jgi:hypothetical protein
MRTDDIFLARLDALTKELGFDKDPRGGRSQTIELSINIFFALQEELNKAKDDFIKSLNDDIE